MTDNSNSSKGIALLCQEDGLITSVLRDDFNIQKNTLKGKLFITVVHPDNRNDSLNFLLETQKQKISIAFRLKVVFEQKDYLLYLVGIHLLSEILIIGTETDKEAAEFANLLQEINNEQSNLIRQLLKKNLKKDNPVKTESELYFEEITHLNNELVNLQREMVRKNIELERLNELMNRFLGMAAHDLRTPLGGIMNFSEFLLEELSGKLSEEHEKFLTIINNSAESMLKMVEELLDVSKIQSGRIDLKLSDFDLIKECKEQVELLRTISAKKSISINFSTTIPLLVINADKDKIDQVISNLVNNAIKFSFPESVINFQATKEEHKVIISVTDTGKGIDPSFQLSLFTPFSRYSTKGTSGEHGTGLGLWIVKKIIEEHKGQLWFESEPGKGSIFYFTLPIS
jgi:two-component system, OmpR family, sensor kinase